MYRSISIVILTFILSKNCFGQFTIQNCQKSPIYKENGGYKKTNLLNKAKVKKESASLMICQLLREIENALKSKNEADKILNEKDAIYQLKEKAIRETSNNLVEIAKKLEGNKISSTKDYEEVLEILKELRLMKCQQIDPITKFLDKKINKIFGDISFKTGSSEISLAGKSEISAIVKSLVSDISEWRSYVSDCNEKVFEEDLFVLVIDIDGYADQQGSAELNLTLSQKRADAVRLELVRQLNDLVVSGKLNIVFDKIQSRGFGEIPPPGVPQTSENDPKRRICIIKSIVGPARILK